MTTSINSISAVSVAHELPSCSDTIFLDFQATTPLDPVVFDAMLPWLKGPWNSHAVEHHMGRIADRAVKNSRTSVANLLGCEPDEITFTSGATEASNMVLRGITNSGDGLVISAIEHASVAQTALVLQDKGRIVRQLAVGTDGILDLYALESALSTRPALVSIMAVNNEIGTIQPIDEAAALCEEYEVPLHTDITQAVGRIPLTMRETSASYASISAHKIYGPQGIGALFVRRGAIRPKPITSGGGQEKGLRPGTLSVANCVGFGVACDQAVTLREEERNHVEQLSGVVLEILSELDGWHVNGSLEDRIPHNLSIAFEGVEADVLLATTPELALATGSACAGGALVESDTLKAIGLPQNLAEGTVRIGFGRTTTIENAQTAARLLCERVRSLREYSA